jgi:hypothetical protein
MQAACGLLTLLGASGVVVNSELRQFRRWIYVMMVYIITFTTEYLWCTLLVMSDLQKKKPGPKPLPPEQRRSGRLAMRTYPDVEAKARRVGTAAVEAAIRKIKEPQ